jgi:hypothetical protein
MLEHTTPVIGFVLFNDDPCWSFSFWIPAFAGMTGRDRNDKRAG